HGVDQCLVPIAQINRAPARSFRDDLIWPGTIWQVYGNLLFERDVFLKVHARWLLKIPQSLSSFFETAWSCDEFSGPMTTNRCVSIHVSPVAGRVFRSATGSTLPDGVQSVCLKNL